jgi:Putative antitoxin of bacterial toxin-antitoxin system, YdaS/YdaT
MRETENPIRKIAERFGNVTAMARQVGVSQPAVWDWVQKGIVPSKQIPLVIEIGRDMDPPIDLEPNDFFPPRYRKAPSRYRNPRHWR